MEMWSIKGIAIVLGISIISFFIGRIVQYLKNKKKDKQKDKQSVRIRAGQAAEQIAPMLPDFPFHPGDCRYIGKPIDYVVFCGASEEDITDVVLLEVKSGKSQLSSQERQLKEVIEKKGVRWEQYRVKF